MAKVKQLMGGKRSAKKKVAAKKFAKPRGYFEGGVVQRSGKAMLHKGETVLKRAETMPGEKPDNMPEIPKSKMFGPLSRTPENKSAVKQPGSALASPVTKGFRKAMRESDQAKDPVRRLPKKI
jgi:hypothetical protein